MRRYAGALARAADQLDELNARSDAGGGTATLTEALRDRADAFENRATPQRDRRQVADLLRALGADD
jgi:hypothetical protein